MKIAIPLDENGMLPDRLGKYSSPELRRDGNNICSFPIEVSDVPERLGPLLFRSLITIPFPYAALLGFIGPLAGEP